MTTHSSILAWRIPWTEEPSRLQSMGSQKVGHDSMHAYMQFIFKFYNFHLVIFYIFYILWYFLFVTCFKGIIIPLLNKNETFLR